MQPGEEKMRWALPLTFPAPGELLLQQAILQVPSLQLAVERSIRAVFSAPLSSTAAQAAKWMRLMNMCAGLMVQELNCLGASKTELGK